MEKTELMPSNNFVIKVDALSLNSFWSYELKKLYWVGVEESEDGWRYGVFCVRVNKNSEFTTWILASGSKAEATVALQHFFKDESSRSYNNVIEIDGKKITDEDWGKQ